MCKLYELIETAILGTEVFDTVGQVVLIYDFAYICTLLVTKIMYLYYCLIN